MALTLPAPFVPGEARSLVEASQANKLIIAISALNTMKIAPDGYGVVTVADQNIIIDLSQLADTIVNLVNTAINGGAIGGAGGGGSTIDTRLTNLEQRLDNASASGTCDNSGNININFSI